jgi:hypothetical protein
MKKILIVSTLVAATAMSAFAQGKVAMQNSSSSPVKLTSDTSLVLAADVTQAGTAVGQSAPLLSGKTLVMGLYAGTSSSSLALFAPRSGDPRGYLMNVTAFDPGVIASTTYQLAGIAAGPTWLQVKVWDSAFPTFEATPPTAYVGSSPVFQFTTGGSVTYPNIAPMLTAPIVVGLVPEPTAAAIAGLGLASMLIFRRRK